jgi:hypothetical protein
VSEIVKREIHIHIHTNGESPKKEVFKPEVVESVDQANLGPQDLNDILKYVMLNAKLPNSLTEGNLASLKLMYYMLSSAFGQHRSEQGKVKFSDEDVRRIFGKKD